MAGLKKPTKRRDNTNPNTALVVFLVLFVLLSIGLGVGMYYGYAGQEKLRADAKSEKDKAGAAKLGEDFFRFMSIDTRLAAGNPVDADEIGFWKTMRDQILGDGGKFKTVIEAKSQDALKKMRDDNTTVLGAPNDQGYGTTFKGKLTTSEAALKAAQAGFSDAQKQLAEAKAELDKLTLKYEDFFKKASVDIKKGNKIALDKASEISASMDKQMKENKELQEKLAGIGAVNDAEMEKKEGMVRKLTTDINKLTAQLKDASANYLVRANTEPHALLLDISKGKTIWDEPLGKIAKVDIDSRQVVINLGSTAGVKEEMTFNVFGNSWKGHAEGQLKGTVEVIRVLDANTSLARITSLYDSAGAEIPLNDRARGRIEREAENVLKAGDLLFNLTFGSHVFIAGVVHWNGPAALGAAGQMRALRDFMALLERQGMKIDGYVDLTDGKIVGGLTPKTRYVVRGDAFAMARKPAAEPKEDKEDAPKVEKEGKDDKEAAKGDKEAKDDKEAKKDDKEVKDDKEGKDAKENKEAAKNGGAAAQDNGGREQRINEAMLSIRNQAIEKGLFIISADNLANVIGYRRPRSAFDLGVSDFRPSLPGATRFP